MSSASQSNVTLSRRWRWLLSCLLIYHVAAVFVSPWNMATFRDSPLTTQLRSWFAPYVQVLNLEWGYSFFAPEPGPSHLVRFELRKADGTTISGTLPDKQAHRPRLLYHRHFMLTDMALSNVGPPDPSWEREPQFERRRSSPWQNQLASAYAQHLLHAYDGASVQLTLIEHQLQTPNQFRENNLRLDEPRTYRERTLGVFKAGDGPVQGPAPPSATPNERRSN